MEHFLRSIVGQHVAAIGNNGNRQVARAVKVAAGVIFCDGKRLALSAAESVFAVPCQRLANHFSAQIVAQQVVFSTAYKST